MDVPFQNIPSNLRIPLFFAELSPALANTNQVTQRALVIGQTVLSAAITPNVPMICAGAQDAINRCGAGSMLALEIAAYVQNDPFGEVWYGPLADDPSAAAATGTMTFTGPASANGTLYAYVGGQLISVGVTSGMTATAIASALVTAATAIPSLAATAANTAGVVTWTAKNKGLSGNDIDLRVNYLGARGSQALPAGVAVTIAPMSGGTVNPSLTALLTNLQDKAFDFIVAPYTDATSVAAMTALLNDQSGRWSWQTQVYGHVFMAYRGTYGGLATYGATLNDQHTSCIGIYDTPTPNFVWASALAGAAAASLKVDPALPLQTVVIQGVLAPPLVSRFGLQLRNTLLYDGISTYTVSASDTVAIENLITTYQKNAAGAPDNSYLQIETMFTLMAVLRALKAVVTSTLARTKLVANNTRIPAGSNFVTCQTISTLLIAQYQSMEPDLVQDSADFAAGLVVQQNSTNPSRVDVLYDPILTGGVRVFALLAQFQLTAPTGPTPVVTS